MIRPEVSVIVSDLRSASDASKLLACLDTIKHDVIGHEERKQKWVRAGVAYPLACVIASSGNVGGTKIRSGSGLRTDGKGALEQETHLQALIVFGSLAQCENHLPIRGGC